MTKTQPLSYLPAMFAACMLFQVLYLLCLVGWLALPGLVSHSVLTTLLPGFQLLTFVSFIYGLIMTMFYGWLFAAIFVFFYNLWPSVASAIFGQKIGTY